MVEAKTVPASEPFAGLVVGVADPPMFAAVVGWFAEQATRPVRGRARKARALTVVEDKS